MLNWSIEAFLHCARVSFRAAKFIIAYTHRQSHKLAPPLTRKKISNRDIEIIIQSKKPYLTWKPISKLLKLKPETVRCAYKREIHKQLFPHKGKVSKSKINGLLSLHLKKNLEEDPLQTCSELSNKLKLECPNVSAALGKHSVRSFMIKNGYNLSKLPIKALISAKNQESQLFWSKKKSKNLQISGTTVWSDETMVRSNPQHNDLFVKIRKGEIQRINLVNVKSQNEGMRVIDVAEK
jgi:hypothetical protein